MGKGGKTTTEVKIPKALETAAKDQLAMAKQVGALGFRPWTGPAVAALQPQQTAAFSNASGAAGAFGLGSGIGAAAGLPKPQTFAGGVQGYSAMPLYEQAVGNLPQSFKDALAAILHGQKPQQSSGGGHSNSSGKGGGSSGTAYYDPNTGQTYYPMQSRNSSK